MSTNLIRKCIATAALAATAATGLVSVNESPASATTGASGVVAVHTGSWGYREVVYGRATTRLIATSSVWELGPLLVGATAGGVAAASGGAYAASVVAASLAALPVATQLYLIKFRAQEADRLGQCFAIVRPTSVPVSFPARTWQDCR